jgi:NADP-dependent 3-hydroxy acid dehydrogenase YdfG
MPVADSTAPNPLSALHSTFGRLDVIINNAGIHDPGLFGTLSVEQYRAMLDVHFFGSLFVAQAAWRHFIKAGYGRIVNTVSEAMLGGIPELTSYGSAKGAVFGLTRNLATEGANHGIRVNAIAPRAYTRMSGSHSDALSEVFGMSKEMIDEINASMPPELCAPAAAFLAYESCSLNGEVLQVGMGGVARIAVLRSQGISMQPLTAEDIAETSTRYGSQRRVCDRIDQECLVTDYESVDFFTDESLVPDPYPFFDHLRSKCPVTPTSQFGVLAVTGHEEALAVYKDPAFSSCISVAGLFSGLPSPRR